MQRTALGFALAATALVAGCPTVPVESVELSYQIGQDLDALHDSYRRLVKERFEDFRARRVAYLEDEWIPTYLGNWIEDGKLVDVASGRLVWSDEANDFVSPTPGRERQELLYTVMSWADAARLDIEDKRAEILGPLDEQEELVLRDLDETFGRMKRANEHITAHLNSIREVQEVQHGALDKLGLREVAARLNQGLVEASKKAEEGLAGIRELDGKVDAVKTRAARLREFAERLAEDENGN